MSEITVKYRGDGVDYKTEKIEIRNDIRLLRRALEKLKYQILIVESRIAGDPDLVDWYLDVAGDMQQAADSLSKAMER